MAAPVFIEAEYTKPPCTGLETREADGSRLGTRTAHWHSYAPEVRPFEVP